MEKICSYHLYCGNNSIVIGNNLPDDCCDYKTIEYYDNLPEDCLDGRIQGNIFVQGDANSLLEKFKSTCNYIEAAGGYVLNSLGQSLVIIRNGLYDLPKGKVEQGESTEDAAVREVVEETGIPSPKIIDKLLDTYHFYRWGNDPKICFKKTYWYSMQQDGIPITKPQLEEGITSCMWVDDSHIATMLEKTHRNLKVLFQLKKEGKI